METHAAVNGTRHLKTFAKKKEADAFHAQVNVDVASGIHTPHSKSITVLEAAEQWLDYLRAEQRERTTLLQYRQHIDLHIAPRIGRAKLSHSAHRASTNSATIY
jgi:integrase